MDGKAAAARDPALDQSGGSPHVMPPSTSLEPSAIELVGKLRPQTVRRCSSPAQVCLL